MAEPIRLSKPCAQGVQFYADPRRARPGEINLHGGCGLYFADPNGEIEGHAVCCLDWDEMAPRNA